MDVFVLRNRLIDDYSSYIRSFITIADERIGSLVAEEIHDGLLWPDPLIQMNPSFQPGKWIGQLGDENALHEECRCVFRIKKDPAGEGLPLLLHTYQEQAERERRRALWRLIRGSMGLEMWQDSESANLPRSANTPVVTESEALVSSPMNPSL